MTWQGERAAEAGKSQAEACQAEQSCPVLPQPLLLCGACSGASTALRQRWRIPPVTQTRDFMADEASLPTTPDPKAPARRRLRLTVPEDENPRGVSWCLC